MHIHINQLSYSYSDGTSALSDINFSLDQGSKTALVGPNGAGKTSLLMAITGLVEYQGDVIVNDIKLSPSNVADLRATMSYVVQNPDEMLFMPDVAEDVSFGLESLGLNEIEIQQRVEQALENVFLSGFEKRSAHHLSYGERRRVCLAVCLARQSDLNLFDEPTRELDPRGRRNFINLFAKMAGTLILATHDLELVLETCDRMILLDRGKIITSGDPKSILENKTLMQEHALEVPHSLSRHPHSH